MRVSTELLADELFGMFGQPLPQAVIQILQDVSDDRTLDDVRSELRSLARQIDEANRA